MKITKQTVVKTWKIIARIAILFLVLGVSFYIFLGDRSAPNNPNLIPKRPPVADTENAYFFIEEARKNMYFPDTKKIESMLKNEDWDTHLALELVEKNEKTFEAINKAVACQRCLVPELEWMGSTLPYLSGWRTIARLGVIKAESLFKQGKEKEAFDVCFKCLELGNLMEDSGGCYINVLVACAIKELALKKIQSFASRMHLTSDELYYYINKLEEYKTDINALKNAFRVEYQIKANSITLTTATNNPETNISKFLRWYHFQPNNTKHMFAEDTLIFIDNSSQNYSDIKPIPSRDKSYEKSSLFGFSLCRNGIGKRYYDLISIGKGTFYFQQKCSLNTLVSATEILLALAVYEKEYGKLPDRLEELTPEYISKAPKDDFNGKSLNYIPEKRMVYSVGYNLKDDGGKQDECKSDLVFVLNAKEKNIEQNDSTGPRSSVP